MLDAQPRPDAARQRSTSPRSAVTWEVIGWLGIIAVMLAGMGSERLLVSRLRGGEQPSIPSSASKAPESTIERRSDR